MSFRANYLPLLVLGLSLPSHSVSAAVSKPFGNNQIPGTIMAADFDSGGQGVAYFDLDAGNSRGSLYRSGEAVEVYQRGNVRQEVMSDAGEHLNYTIDIKESGRHQFVLNYASRLGANISIKLDGKEISKIDLPGAGISNSFGDLKLPIMTLPSGVHTLSIHVNSGSPSLFKMTSELLPGKEYFLSKLGSGKKDGSSKDNALPVTSMDQTLNVLMAPGDTLFILGELYNASKAYFATISTSGTDELKKKIVGLDVGQGLPVFKGGWSETNMTYHAHSANFLIMNQAQHWEISNLIVKNYMNTVKLTEVEDLKLKNISILGSREAINMTSVKQSVLSGISIVGYTKLGIRLVHDNSDLLVEKTLIDATGSIEGYPSEAFPFGVTIQDPACITSYARSGVGSPVGKLAPASHVSKPVTYLDTKTYSCYVSTGTTAKDWANVSMNNHDITFDQVTSQNNMHIKPTLSYQNGDGFSVEKSAYNMKYLNSMAIRNTDGGWDDKSIAPYYENCVSMRNKRNFRVWNQNEKPAVFVNVLSAFAEARELDNTQPAGFWTYGKVEIHDSTFFANYAQIQLDANTETGAYTSADVLVTNSVLTSTGTCNTPFRNQTGVKLAQVGNAVCDPKAGNKNIPLIDPSLAGLYSNPQAFEPQSASLPQGYRHAK